MKRVYVCPQCGETKLIRKVVKKPDEEYVEYSCPNCQWWTFDIDAYQEDFGVIESE